jgi:hypothetical protein
MDESAIGITKKANIFDLILKNNFKNRRVAMQNKLLHKNVKAAFLSILVLCVVAISLATQGLAQGEVYRPPNPVMDYVPQNIGIIDKTYPEFTELDCRECHGFSTAVRHHNTQWALESNCLYCHNEFPVLVPPERNCQVCHNDTWVKHPNTYGFPHHRTDWANSGQCNQCHDPSLVVEAYSVSPPSYPPGPNTPTPASCENCHFWDDPVNPTIHGTGHIETRGPTGAGMHPLKLALGFDPVNLPSMGTHEEINGMVYTQCALCHWSEPGNQWDTSPYNPLAIRFCENCHTMDLLHANPEHVNTNNIYTVNGVPNQEVTGSVKCMACHGSATTTTLITPNGGEIIPTGVTYTITWSAPSEAVKFDIGYSLDDGAQGTWKLIASNITSYSYNWTVPAPDGNKNTCRAGVRGYNASGGVVGTDTSNNPFTIEVIKLTDPDGGEILTSGTTYQIRWQTNSTIRPVQTVKIYGSPNEGQSGTWRLLTTINGNPGYYDWTVPLVGTIKDKCRLGVLLLDSGSTNIGQDAGDGNFTIHPAP